jgi:hypothetical protein
MRLALAASMIGCVAACGSGDAGPSAPPQGNTGSSSSGSSGGSGAITGPGSSATSGGGSGPSTTTGAGGGAVTTGTGGGVDPIPPWQSYDAGGSGTTLLGRDGWMAHATIHLEGDRPWEGKQGYPPPDAVDGDPETFWEAGMHQDTYGQRLDQFFMVDLRFPQKFSRLVLDSSTCHPVDSNHADGVTLTSPTNNYPRGFKVDVSSNGKDFTVALPTGAGTSDLTDVSFAEQTAQYLRISILKVVDFPTTWVICELRLYR